MAKELPYFRWFPKDAAGDEKYSAMDDAERGFFHRCLDKSWLNEGLPEDAEERARVLMTDRAVADERWKRVGKCFVRSHVFVGKVVNPRQEKERDHAIMLSRNGRKAVEARYGRTDVPTDVPTDAPTDDLRHAHARIAQRASGSDSVFTTPHVNGKPPKTEESKNGTFANYKADESFSHFVLAAKQFWGGDLIEEDLSQAWMFSWKKFDFEQKLDATRRLQARIEVGEDCRFVTRLPKYLENGAWKRPPRTPSAPVAVVDKNSKRRDEVNAGAKLLRNFK